MIAYATIAAATGAYSMNPPAGSGDWCGRSGVIEVDTHRGDHGGYPANMRDGANRRHTQAGRERYSVRRSPAARRAP
jgi:hypothetical protein